MHYIESFSKYLKSEKRCSKHTVIAYANDVKNFLDFLGGSEIERVAAVKPKIVRNWIVSLSDSGMSASTIHRKISALRTFYKHLQIEGLVDYNPAHAVNLPKIPRRLPVFVQEQAMDMLLDKVEFGTDYEGIRNKLIIELFYGTGMRLSELVGLRSSDIDLKSRLVKVRGKRDKERLIPLTNEAILLLSTYNKVRLQFFENNDSPWLFLTAKGEQVYHKLVYRIVNSSLSMVSTMKKKSPHILRHTYATVLLNRGADLSAIKELLGHSNLNATQVYTHTTFEQLNTIYKQAHPRA
ncbi:MAG: tyrosine-type recombinase/integrase [Bacteroidales bacterium]|jgi:integrase/recombinase XerC|nr:tyrosine-type recombinase/integrase [Bacteroidales bacterium]